MLTALSSAAPTAAVISPLAGDDCPDVIAPVEIERMDLNAAQGVSVLRRLEAVDQADLSLLPEISASVTGFAENRTVVFSSTVSLSGGAVYLHPNLNQAIAYFEVAIFTEGEGTVLSSRYPPPWLVY